MRNAIGYACFNMQAITVHGVLFKEGDWWVGQWLEYDIAAQAKTVKQLAYELQRSLIGHVVIRTQEGRKPFELMEKAPERYWKMYEEGMKIESQHPLELPKGKNLPTVQPELHLVA
jgi:hypothetical protein